MKKHVSLCIIVALGGFIHLVPENRLDAFGPGSQRNVVAQKPLTNFDYISEAGMEIDDETPLPQLIAHSPSVTIEPQIFATGRRYLILLGYDYGGGSYFLPNGRADAFDVTDRLVKPVGRTVVAKAQSGRRPLIS